MYYRTMLHRWTVWGESFFPGLEGQCCPGLQQIMDQDNGWQRTRTTAINQDAIVRGKTIESLKVSSINPPPHNKRSSDLYLVCSLLRSFIRLPLMSHHQEPERSCQSTLALGWPAVPHAACGGSTERCSNHRPRLPTRRRPPGSRTPEYIMALVSGFTPSHPEIHTGSSSSICVPDTNSLDTESAESINSDI